MVMNVTFRSCVAMGMRFEIQDRTKIIAAERRALVRTELFDLSARTSDQYIVRAQYICQYALHSLATHKGLDWFP